MTRMRDTNITQARADIRATGADLAPGNTRRLRCPFCLGGRSHDESFYVTRTDDGGGVLYVCHRASCGKRGRLSLGGGLAPVQSITRVPLPGRWEGSLCPLRLPSYRKLYYEACCGPFLKTPSANGLFTVADDPEETVWILHDLYRQRIGVQTRKMLNGRKIVRSHKETATSLYNFFPGEGEFNQPHRPMWIVEDCLSAAAISSYGLPAVALLGTFLHKDVRDSITVCPVPAYVVALDPGAEKQAALVKSSLECYTTRPCFVLYMDKDFKNMTPQEQQQTLIRGAV
jgi:hypothetical protein